MKKLVLIRKEFPKTKDVQARKQMAKEEFDAWFEYLQSRKEDLPKSDFEIDEKNLSLIKENFDRFKVTKKLLVTHNIGQKNPQSSFK